MTHVEFHFVNIPIRTGEAWVFPVGLPDALWLVFRNPTMRVFSWSTLPQAFGVPFLRVVTTKKSIWNLTEADGYGTKNTSSDRP